MATDVAGPAPAKPSKFNANLIFAATALAFGLALLLGWRFGPDGSNPHALTLALGVLMTTTGACFGANELGVLTVLVGDSDSDGGGSDGGGD